MFWYAEGPENGNGYTFWIDELKYEKLGTVAQPRPAILMVSINKRLVSLGQLLQSMD
jgi:hypothetical protein